MEAAVHEITLDREAFADSQREALERIGKFAFCFYAKNHWLTRAMAVDMGIWVLRM